MTTKLPIVIAEISQPVISADRVLLSALQQVLPRAKLTITEVPLLANLTAYKTFKLCLIDENFCHQDLDYKAIEKLWQHTPFWIFAWASGQILAQYILQYPELVADKIVMDFGAGSGIVGIAAKLAGAKQVICCDIDTISLKACQENAQLNQVNIDLLDDLYALPTKFGIAQVDVLLVADVLYDKINLPLLDLFLKFAKTVWIADSRVKNFSHPAYQKIITLNDTTTLPDMDEAKQFNQVALYRSY